MPAVPEHQIDLARLPRHIAVIMDGNGRWAQQRGLSRVEGHKRGKDSVRAIVEEARRLGVSYLSLFAFSTENWDRPRTEVDALMRLLRRYLRSELGKMMKNGIRLLASGDVSRLPANLQAELAAKIEATKDNTDMTVILCVSYGGREEIVQAAKRVAARAVAGELEIDDIDAGLLAAHMHQAEVPDPDLLIRTSGEMRISNFYLWQVAYSEVYFTDTLWPDFREAELHRAIEQYQQRERRFGKVDVGATEGLRAAR